MAARPSPFADLAPGERKFWLMLAGVCLAWAADRIQALFCPPPAAPASAPVPAAARFAGGYDLNGVFDYFFWFLLAVFLGLLVDLLWLVFRSRRSDAASAPSLWAPVEVFYSAVVFFFFQFALGAAFNALEFFSLRPSFGPVPLVVLFTLLPELALVFFLLHALCRRRGPGALSALFWGRLCPSSLWRPAVLYIGFLPLLFFSAALSTAVLSGLGFPLQAHPLTDVFLGGGSPLRTLLLSTFAVVLAPLCEEVFFRAALFPALCPRLGRLGAAAASALLFSVCHWNVFQAVPVFLLGVVLALLYDRDRALVVPVLFHSLNNLLAVAAVVAMKSLYGV